MKTRVLFLDDEQSVLNGFQRRLGVDYDLTCCTSGEEALKLIDELGSFAAVVTDMRMPQMNGIQFIRQARMVAPDSIYLMLTGNQDQTTVIQAMNEGQVFRFLNKPCDHEALKRAIDAALHQYRLVTSEKELLHKTFVGAVGVLTEVLDISQPSSSGHSSSIEQLMQSLGEALEIANRWEYRLTARMSLLGLSFLPQHERALLEVGSPTDSKFQNVYRHATEISSRLVEKIPRLHTVAEIIATQCQIDGSIHFEEKDSLPEIVRIGATLLRVSTLWHAMTRSGLCAEAAIKELLAVMPELCPKVVGILKQNCLDFSHQETIAVDIDELCEGLILAEDVVATDGSMLMRQGRRLSWATVEKLRVHHTTVTALKPISVIANSFEAARLLV